MQGHHIWAGLGKWYTSILLKLLFWKIQFQGSQRLEKYLNIQDCLEKSLKIKLALKNTQRP